MPDIRSEFGRTVFETAVDLFVAGQAATTSAFNRACGIDRSGRTKVNTYFDNLVRLGVLQLQATGHGNGKSPHVFNWSGKPVDDVTLGDAVQPYLADPAIPRWQTRRARTALRFLLDLDRRCDDREILKASERTAATEISETPDRVFGLAEEAGLSRQTAKNYRADLRRLLRYACEHDSIPIVFPSVWCDDVWNEAMLKWFPRAEDLGPEGHAISGRMRGQLRSGCRRYREALVAIAPEEADRFADPADATPEIARQVADYWTTRGEIDRRHAVMAVFSQLASQYGVGPNAATQGLQRDTIYLSAAPGESVAGLTGFVNVARHHGLRPEWQDVFTWLHTYETTPSAKELRRRGFPARRGGRIKAKSFAKRISATRALLGVAVNVMGMDPSTLLVARVFGEDYGRIIDRLVEVWGKTGEHEYSAGLRDIIVQSGMIAYALFRRAGHHADQTFTSGEEKSRRERRRIVREEAAVPQTDQQRAYLNSYDEAQGWAAEVAQEMEKRSPSAANSNSIKDIREVVRDTPPNYWIAILDGFLEEIRSAERSGHDEEYGFHSLVLAAVIHGLILSTGFRQAEPTHARFGSGPVDHYDREAQTGERDRVIRLFRWDRKNGRALNGVIRERYLPCWLEELYLQRTVRFFKNRGLKGPTTGPRLAERPRATLECPAPTGGIDVATGLPFADHAFLLVNTFGVPYGCPEEAQFGEGRDERRHAQRVSNMAKFWKRRALRMAARLGLRIPPGEYGFTLHDMRNVMGYWVRSRYGTPQAASYLGDSEGTVETFYSALDGQDVDLSGVEDLPAPQLLGEPAAPVAPVAPVASDSTNGMTSVDVFRQEVAVIDELRDRLGWDSARYRSHIEAVMMKYGIGA